MTTLSQEVNPTLSASKEWNGLINDLKDQERKLSQEAPRSAPELSPQNSPAKVSTVVNEAEIQTLRVIKDSKYLTENNLKLRIHEIYQKLISELNSKVPDEDVSIDIRNENRDLKENLKRMEDYVNRLKSQEPKADPELRRNNELLSNLRDELNEKNKLVQNQDFHLRSIKNENDYLKLKVLDLEKKMLSPTKARVREEKSPVIEDMGLKERLIEVSKERDELKD